MPNYNSAIHARRPVPGSADEYNYVFERLHSAMLELRQFPAERIAVIKQQYDENKCLIEHFCNIMLIREIAPIAERINEVAGIVESAFERVDDKMIDLVNIWETNVEDSIGLVVLFTTVGGVPMCILESKP